jgi:hypothetical protein
MKNLKDKSDRSRCLDEIEINRYVLHQCSDKERQKIQAHLVECPLCRSEVVFLKKNQPEIQDEKKWGELPEQLYNKGTAFIKEMIKKQSVSPLEIFLRFFQNQWEIVRHTGTVIPQPVSAARGETPEKKGIISSIVKEFNEFQVMIDVKGNVEGSIDLQIRVKSSKDGSIVPQVQFTLWDQKRQRILEEFIRDGEITFEGLVPGVYSVRIAQQERGIGEINLDLT